MQMDSLLSTSLRGATAAPRGQVVTMGAGRPQTCSVGMSWVLSTKPVLYQLAKSHGPSPGGFRMVQGQWGARGESGHHGSVPRTRDILSKEEAPGQMSWGSDSQAGGPCWLRGWKAAYRQMYSFGSCRGCCSQWEGLSPLPPGFGERPRCPKYLVRPLSSTHLWPQWWVRPTSLDLIFCLALPLPPPAAVPATMLLLKPKRTKHPPASGPLHMPCCLPFPPPSVWVLPAPPHVSAQRPPSQRNLPRPLHISQHPNPGLLSPTLHAGNVSPWH